MLGLQSVCTALCMHKKGCHHCHTCPLSDKQTAMISEELHYCIVVWHFEQQKQKEACLLSISICSGCALYPHTEGSPHKAHRGVRHTIMANGRKNVVVQQWLGPCQRCR